MKPYIYFQSKIFVPSALLSLGKWQFLVATFNRTLLNIYKDGIPIYSNNSLTYSNSTVYRNNCYVGKSNWPTEGYSYSYLDDLRIYNTSLSRDEIIQIMNENKENGKYLIFVHSFQIFEFLVNLSQFFIVVERSTLMRKYPRSIPPVRENKKYSIFYWEYFWAISSQVRIEHDLPLPMILMGEQLANCVKSLDCRCGLGSDARTKTRNDLLLFQRGAKLFFLIETFLKPIVNRSNYWISKNCWFCLRRLFLFLLWKKLFILLSFITFLKL